MIKNICEIPEKDIYKFISKRLDNVKTTKISECRWGYRIEFKIDNFRIRIWLVYFYNKWLESVFGSVTIKRGMFGEEITYTSNSVTRGRFRKVRKWIEYYRNSGMEEFLLNIQKHFKTPLRDYELERDERMLSKYGISW